MGAAGGGGRVSTCWCCPSWPPAGTSSTRRRRRAAPPRMRATAPWSTALTEVCAASGHALRGRPQRARRRRTAQQRGRRRPTGPRRDVPQAAPVQRREVVVRARRRAPGGGAALRPRRHGHLLRPLVPRGGARPRARRCGDHRGAHQLGRLVPAPGVQRGRVLPRRHRRHGHCRAERRGGGVRRSRRRRARRPLPRLLAHRRSRRAGRCRDPAGHEEETLLVADVDLDSVAAARRRTPRNHLIEDRRPDSYNAVVVPPPRPAGAVTTVTPP